MTSPPLLRIELPFLAPIPAGHEVLVVWLRQTPDDQRTRLLVLDQSARVLYCDDRLWGPLGANEQATLDPVGLLTRLSWVEDRRLMGRVSGAMVTMGASTELRTRLFLEPGSAPYR